MKAYKFKSEVFKLVGIAMLSPLGKLFMSFPEFLRESRYFEMGYYLIFGLIGFYTGSIMLMKAMKLSSFEISKEKK